MIFKFKNYGYVDECEVELANLTVLFGPNNVGKTYISYGIYFILSELIEVLTFPITDDQLDEIGNSGVLKLDLDHYRSILQDAIDSAAIGKLSKSVQSFFNAPDGFFANAELGFKIQEGFDYKYALETKIPFGKENFVFFKKLKGESTFTITLQGDVFIKLSSNVLYDIINRAIASTLVLPALTRPFAITSERTGISLFYKELDIHRNLLVDHLASGKQVEDHRTLLQGNKSRYAKPIQDNIDIIRDYDSIVKRKSFLREQKDTYGSIFKALSELSGGAYKSDSEQIMYQPRKERGRDKVSIPMYLASSSIKSLFLLDLYINHLAEPGGLLLIDEPELNLHPENQRSMAKLLARLINAGIKVLITTHSDFLVREINNRIMLSSDFRGRSKILKKSKIQQDELLKPSDVNAYSITTDHGVRANTVDGAGINAELFDEVIAQSNALSTEIYFSLDRDHN